MKKKYYWYKLKNDFFNNLKMKKLRKIAGGDCLTIVYLKLILYSLEEDGIISFKHVENTLSEELSLVIDENIENVKMTLQYLLSCQLLEPIGNDQYLLPEAVENIGSESDSAERMRRLREKQKNNSIYKQLSASQCDIDVTRSDTEKEKEEEKEKEKKRKEKEKEKERNSLQEENLSSENNFETNVLTVKSYLSRYNFDFKNEENMSLFLNICNYLKIMNLDVVIKACNIAIENNALSFKYILSILENFTNETKQKIYR